MSTSGIDTDLEIELSKERQNLFEKLSNIFGPEVANDYVCPKTNDETRQQLSLEELRLLKFNEQDEYFRRLRTMVHYKTTTQSLPRADLEATYQSFVRDEVARQSSRYELEKFVRNSSDIDSAKRYVNMANDLLINPQQSLLLFRSSKLNEQKANLLKSSSYSHSLPQVNHDPSIQKYFSEQLHNTSKYPILDEEEFFNPHKDFSRCPSMHLKHNEKKYHIQFAKDFAVANTSHHPTNNRHLLLTERIKPKNIESLFSTENSTVQGQSQETNTFNIHRELFPPLTLSALSEYRPTVTPQPTSLRKTSSSMNIQQREKPMRKADFLWNQSMISSTKHQ